VGTGAHPDGSLDASVEIQIQLSPTGGCLVVPRTVLDRSRTTVTSSGDLNVSQVSAPARLYRKIEVPKEFQTTGEIDGQSLAFGGDIRVGDLTGDGPPDLLVYRCDHLSELKPTFLGAFDLDGQVIWQVGSRGAQPLRPGPVAVFDIDGDGSEEVITFFHQPSGNTPRESMADVVIQIRDGSTGELKLEAKPEILIACEGWGSNWCHHRIFIANLRGLPKPSDFVIKLGEKLLAFDNHLNLLWKYEIEWNAYSECSAYIPSVGDIDGDGRDEVNGGYYLLNPDGTPRWAKQLAPNMDSVAILPWDRGIPRAICSGGGHVLDADGNVALALGEHVVPHGQEVRVGNFLPNEAAPQMAIRYLGHHPDILMVDNNGHVLHDFKVNSSPNETGMEVIHWNGPKGPDLLYNGGALFDGMGAVAVSLPGLPDPIGPEKMGWYHAIPGDFCGDLREDVLVYNPWDTTVYIYTQDPLDESAYAGYSAGPRQYNARLMD